MKPINHSIEFVPNWTKCYWLFPGDADPSVVSTEIDDFVAESLSMPQTNYIIIPEINQQMRDNFVNVVNEILR